MTEPERIWAFYSDVFGAMWTPMLDDGATEYTRSDLIPAMIAEAVRAEREACAEMVDEMALAARKSYDVLCDVDHAAKISAAILADEFARFAAAIRARGDST